ncbi:MAG TPA: phosphatase PAP2 family protein [Acidobacteriaceae bacterium]
MRSSEWIQIGFATLLALAGWMTSFTTRPLPLRRRWIITGLAVAAIVIVALARWTGFFLPQQYQSILRDWLTVALFLIPYWQTGQFFLGPNVRIQKQLLAFDRRMLHDIATKSGTERSPVGFLFEVAYLFCYPFVPLGLAAMYATGLRSKVSSFWLVVLVSTYICYAITPFVPAFPPRALIGDLGPAAESSENVNKGRIFNRWILKHGSIHAISFPSAHVASALAVALVLLRFSPLIGLVFLVVAILISIGAVIGRYHYALDVLLGAATAILVFLASYRYL